MILLGLPCCTLLSCASGFVSQCSEQSQRWAADTRCVPFLCSQIATELDDHDCALSDIQAVADSRLPADTDLGELAKSVQRIRDKVYADWNR